MGEVDDKGKVLARLNRAFRDNDVDWNFSSRTAPEFACVRSAPRFAVWRLQVLGSRYLQRPVAGCSFGGWDLRPPKRVVKLRAVERHSPGVIIRGEQMRTLCAYAEDAYVKEMAAHLRAFAPELAKVVGEPALLRIGQSGIQKARSYGLANRGPVRFFLELMCTLGSGFDTDPQLAWAFEVLRDGSAATDVLRAERLHERMVAYLDEVAGPNRQYATDAVKRWIEYRLETPREGWSERAVTGTMARLYPQKFEFVGESTAGEIVGQAAAEAARYGLPRGEGMAVLAGMKFYLGHRICEDPFYPWIAAPLQDPLIVDGEGRLAKLVSRLRTYGTYALANMSQS